MCCHVSLPPRYLPSHPWRSGSSCSLSLLKSKLPSHLRTVVSWTIQNHEAFNMSLFSFGSFHLFLKWEEMTKWFLKLFPALTSYHGSHCFQHHLFPVFLSFQKAFLGILSVSKPSKQQQNNAVKVEFLGQVNRVSGMLLVSLGLSIFKNVPTTKEI